MREISKRSARASGRLAAIACLGLALAVLLPSCVTSAQKNLALEWYDLGNSWYDKGDWSKAGGAYSRALRLDPGLAAASYNLARALAEAEDWEGSLRVIAALEKRDPDNVRVLSIKAYALFKAGRGKEASVAYERVLLQNPYAPDAVYNAALLKLAEPADPESAGLRTEAEDAASILEPYVKAVPEDGAALLLLGRAYERLGRDDQALASYEAAKAMNKIDAAALEHMGLVYEKQRKFSEALACLAAATSADPKRPKAWFSLARLRLVVAEDGSGGLEALKKALDAGFDDKQAAAALLDEPVLAEREAVNTLLKSKQLTE